MKNKILPAALAVLLCSLPAFSQTTTVLTPAMVAGLSPAQFATLTNEQLRGLSEAHVAALSPNQLRVLNASQINALLLNQVAVLSAGQTQGLANARALSLAQIGVLSATALAGVPASEVAAFSNDQVAVLSQAQIEALSPQQMDGVMARLSNAQILGMSPTKFGALTRDQHLTLKAELMPSLNLSYLGNWMGKNTAADATFTAEQVAALTPLQVARLPVFTLTAAQIAAWGRTQINALMPPNSVNLYSKLTAAQVAWLTPLQVQGISPMGMTDTQQQAFRQIFVPNLPYCPSLADPAVYGAMPAPVFNVVNSYRGVWDRAAASNCFEPGTYKVGANCPADAKSALIGSATNLLNVARQYSTATPPPPNFPMLRITDCRLP